MLQNLLPKKDIFFPLFRQMVDQNHQGAEDFVKLLHDLKDAPRYTMHISQLEKKGDNTARKIFDELHKTFITPFDREDIHRLTRSLDSVLDQLNRAARQIMLYQITKLSSDILTLSSFIVQATQLLKQAVQSIEHLSRADAILLACNKVYEIEEETDDIILTGMSHLFSSESDVKNLLKMKEIYESFQLIFKGCKDAAIVVKSIVLEYS